MAKKTVVHLIDDIDGADASQTIRFAWRGASYEIDLSDKNADAFDKALAPFVAAAKLVSGRRTSKLGSKAVSAKLDLAAIRSWAVTNGHTVAQRGRIPGAIVEAFHAAQHAVHAGGAPSAGPAVTGAAAKMTPAKRTTRKAAPAKKAAPARKSAAKRATRRAAPAKKAAAKKVAAKKAVR